MLSSFRMSSIAVLGLPTIRSLRRSRFGLGIPSIALSDVAHAAMKSRRSFLRLNLSNWRASINTGLIQFCLAVSVSFTDENTHSQGTDVAWTGRKSMAIADRIGNTFLFAYSTSGSDCYLTRRSSLTSQKHRVSVSASDMDEVYLRNSASTSDDCGSSFVNVECSILNCVGHSLLPVTGARCAGASGTVAAVVNDIWLWYWCIYKKVIVKIQHTVINCTYMPKNDLLGLVNIILIPIAFDVGEPGGRIENCKAKEVVRVVNNQQTALHMAMIYTSVSSIWR